MIRSGSHFAAALAIALAVVPSVSAASSPADVATARELYKQGADALDAGNASAAVEKLTAAWALLQTPVIGLALARAHEKLGHLIECREAALAVVRMARTPDETTLSTAARTDADKLAAAIAPRVPHLTILVQGATPDETTVKLDGVAIPSPALKVARQANPGSHTITAVTADGRHAQTAILLGEAEAKEATITLPIEKNGEKRTEPSASSVTTPTPTPTPTPVPPSPGTITPPPHKASISPVVWVGTGVGGVGLAFGAIFGAITFGSKGALAANCTLPNASGDGKAVCPASSAGDLSLADTAGTISTIGFVTAGVGVAILVTGMFLGHGSEPQTHATITPMLGPISGVTGTFW